MNKIALFTSSILVVILSACSSSTPESPGEFGKHIFHSIQSQNLDTLLNDYMTQAEMEEFIQLGVGKDIPEEYNKQLDFNWEKSANKFKKYFSKRKFTKRINNDSKIDSIQFSLLEQKGESERKLIQWPVSKEHNYDLLKNNGATIVIFLSEGNEQFKLNLQCWLSGLEWKFMPKSKIAWIEK